MTKKLLVVYCTYGSGHKSIAESMANYFKEFGENYEVEVLDINKYANFWGKVSIKLFDFNIKHRPEFLFDFLYELVDNRLGSLHQMQFVKKAFANKRLEKKLASINPDITISTHYFAGNIISYYNKKNVIDSKIVTISTDYASHSFWRKDHENHDAYIVANQVVKNEMVEKGVEKKKIHTFGLPFDEKKLLNIRDKESVIKDLNLNPDYKTYFMFGGGSAGAMFYYNYFKAIAKENFPINLIFVAGKNKALENKAKNFVKSNKLKNVRVLGFVNDVYSLMNIAEYVITKPGAATVTECLILKVPMIIIPGYGGQEKYNARFVSSKGYGYKVRGTLFFRRLVKKTILNDSAHKKFKRNLEKLKDNESTKKTLELCEKLLKDKNRK